MSNLQGTEYYEPPSSMGSGGVNRVDVVKTSAAPRLEEVDRKLVQLRVVLREVSDLFQQMDSQVSLCRRWGYYSEDIAGIRRRLEVASDRFTTLVGTRHADPVHAALFNQLWHMVDDL